MCTTFIMKATICYPSSSSTSGLCSDEGFHPSWIDCDHKERKQRQHTHSASLHSRLELESWPLSHLLSIHCAQQPLALRTMQSSWCSAQALQCKCYINELNPLTGKQACVICCCCCCCCYVSGPAPVSCHYSSHSLPIVSKKDRGTW